MLPSIRGTGSPTLLEALTCSGLLGVPQRRSCFNAAGTECSRQAQSAAGSDSRRNAQAHRGQVRRPLDHGYAHSLAS